MSAQLLQFPRARAEWTPSVGDQVLLTLYGQSWRGVVISEGDTHFGEPVWDVRLPYSGSTRWAYRYQLEPLPFWSGEAS